MKRRKFLKTAGLMAGGLAASSMLPNIEGGPAKAEGLNASKLMNSSSGRPNILVILVDQLRFPQGLFDQGMLDVAAPNLAQLRNQSVSFDAHFAAATGSSPSRATMLTGLYTHQNGMFLSNSEGLEGSGIPTPSLDPDFPTWGSILRKGQFGYNTSWWGKWNLSGNDQANPDYAKPYGFNFGGQPFPSPNGAPGQGLGVDPVTTQVFDNWLKTSAQTGAWCATVSLVNPSDIAWFPWYTNGIPGEDNPPSIFNQLPYNFELWPAAGLPPGSGVLGAEGKPGLQQVLVALTNALTGTITPAESDVWKKLLDLYYQLTHYVDIQIGAVLQALEDSGAADNTIVVFTSDHGEYGGSHGLRNRGFAVYEEAIHVPLYVKDPTGTVIPPDQRGTTRNQFTSHVDILPLLMSLASGDNTWRMKSQYAHLAGRADLAAMLSDPNAQGREYILHTSDEDFPEEAARAGATLEDLIAIKNGLGDPPSHVIGYRTRTAKLGVYSRFAPGTVNIIPDGQESELYNYLQDGINEVINHAPSGSAPDPALYATMYEALFNPINGAAVNELWQPLPNSLKEVQKRAFNDYLAYKAKV